MFKTHKGGFGLLLVGVDPPVGAPPLRNIELRYTDEKLVRWGSTSSRLRRCLELKIDPLCDSTSLATIVDRLGEIEKSGSYTTPQLLKILNDVIELVRAPGPGPSKDLVLGAWGELKVLETLLKRSKTATGQRVLLSSWEAAGPSRDIIDFRFARGKVAFEVKSSLGDRLHHINGFGQVTIPPGFHEGFLASVLVNEPAAATGQTCADIVGAIRGGLAGTKSERITLERELTDKLELRGLEATDDRFAFLARDPYPALYPMVDVPRPTIAPLVTEVEWTADLSRLTPITAKETEAVLRHVVP